MTRIIQTLFLAGSLIGCTTSDPPTDETTGDTGDASNDETVSETASELTSCVTPADAFNPFTGSSSTGRVSTYPWKGYSTTYPAGDEDMRGYSLPTTIECSSGKSARSHLDVTAGCLKAVAVGSYSRGQIQSTSDGAFRVVALPFTGSESHPLKWTDMSNQYRFYYTGTSGPGVDPGFKVFDRYRTEDDLYVASWRVDGIIQIKKKQCGVYKTLAQTTHAKPSTGAWHTVRFDAIGTQLDFYLDGTRVLSATDSTFSWGTAGIRTDAMTGAYLDDWTVK